MTTKRVSIAVFSAVFLVGALLLLTLAPVAAQSPPQAEVIVSALNVRQGPGIQYPATDVALEGDVFEISAADATGNWLQVVLAEGETGWISGKPAYTRVIGSLDDVPVVEDVQVAQPSVVGEVPTSARGKLIFMTSSGGDIYLVNADGSGLRRLTSGIDPVLSPDGTQVAFTRWGGPQHGAPGSVWVINADGTGERVVHNQANQPKSPAWSPDGREIAVNMQQGGRLDYESKCSNSLPSEPLKADEDGDYFRVKVEIEQDGDVDIKFCYTLLPHPFWGLRVIDVPSGTFEDQPRDLFTYAPAWDPTNDWHVVYDGEKGLVNLDLNRGATWALTDKVGDHTPVFSPDGQRIAVAFNQGDNFDIHVMNADGSGRLRLTKTPLSAIVEQRIRGEAQKSWNNVAPTWSPDGSEIAFLTDRTGRWEIWVMNADGSNQRPMFAPGVLSAINFEFNNVDERMLSWGP